MRRQLVRFGGAAALLLGSSVPAAAWGTVSGFGGGSWCTASTLQICMSFDLQRDGATNDYMLIATWDSSQGGGLWTAFGLYQEDPGQPGPNPTVSNVFFADANGVQIAGPAGWTAGGNNDPSISGDGKVWFVSAADTDNGVNGALGAPLPATLRIRFTADLTNYPGSTLYARAHIQSFGDNGCSLKPDSRDTGDHLVGTAAEADADCGTTYDGGGGSGDSTVPEPISLVLLGSGLLGIGGARLRRRRQG